MGLTVDQIRQHVTTELGDEALQRLLDDARLEIEDRIGPPGLVTEYRDGGLTYLMTQRRIDPAGPITIVEATDTTTPVTLDEDDYRVSADGRYIRRLDGGTNARLYWYPGQVAVTFSAADDTPRRNRAQIALVKLEVGYDPNVIAETIDGYSYQTANNATWNHETVRESILASLEGGLGWA